MYIYLVLGRDISYFVLKNLHKAKKPTTFSSFLNNITSPKTLVIDNTEKGNIAYAWIALIITYKNKCNVYNQEKHQLLLIYLKCSII